MDLFDAIADPVRRNILERLNRSELAAGEIAAEYNISRPAISRHLRVLREVNLVSAREEGRQLKYSLNVDRFADIQAWLDQFKDPWTQRLDALETEVYRTRRERRLAQSDIEEKEQTA